MNQNMFFIFLVVQFLIQMFIYKQTLSIFRYILKFLSDTIVIFSSQGKEQDIINKLTNVSLLFYNILISLLVLKFTSTGAYSGMSNLFASCFVGVFMYFDFRTKGQYHITFNKDIK